MNGKTILSMTSPVTQTVEAVTQLIKYRNRGQGPAEMPDFYRISANMVLVRSKKGDAYYVTTPNDCSCPAATYSPGKPCKHQRLYFPAPATTSENLGDIGDFRPVFKHREPLAVVW
ncbi:MAG: hypothetical protein A4E45_00774 [Methanosaeta sp. PtaB.Bin039]|nr:MAG: hypothetical protein A4E45_00774 [Methanosaeta sp. PtaB.Bin039]OPY44384.1 MAG: hypothetical protein A4E47_01619 [Methanosaeta sp. PtaU1.Bin028]